MEDRNIQSLGVGDYCVLKRSFNREDFKQFAELSGDHNPLHHDSEYAQATSFGRCIVPTFLAVAPLSKIAGEYLPGHRSLILKYSVSAKSPIFFDEEVNYSAKIVGRNLTDTTITLRLVAFVKRSPIKIVFSGEMLVKVREDPTELRNGCTPTT